MRLAESYFTDDVLQAAEVIKRFELVRFVLRLGHD